MGIVKADREYYSDAERDDKIWDHQHRPKICRLLDRASVETLREVAAIMGYEGGK